MNNALEIDDMKICYGKTQIIHGVSFGLDSCEKVAVLGRNGMGKTTMLKGIMGILPMNNGSIQLYGKEIKALGIHKRSQAGIAYVPQGKEIFPDFTVRENLEFGAYAHPINITGQMKIVLDYFPALNNHIDRKSGVLSGGLQQQLAIGRALMSLPKILLLDEPTEGIQPNVVNELAVVLNRINREMKVSIIIVEQNLKFAMKIAERFIILQKGRIVSAGNLEELTEHVMKKYLAV